LKEKNYSSSSSHQAKMRFLPLTILALLSTLSTTKAALFYCDTCGYQGALECSASLNEGNYFEFGAIQGCTHDGKYCAHVTTPSSSAWKIWVENTGTGCSHVFPVQIDWTLVNPGGCREPYFIEGSAC
jgi:hypothetical protein